MTVAPFVRHPEPSLADQLAEARAKVSDLAARQTRSLETAICDLIELAEECAASDGVQSASVREVARRVAARLGEERLTLAALLGR